jgi:2-polyprenyl-3-methyl-5-hydroxy-6-metoxy-1,4-benzoquinol methylase
LQRYTAFLWELIRPFVGRRVLEVGAGTGIMTRYLATRESLVTTDVDLEYVALLEGTLADNPKVEIRQLDLTRVRESDLSPAAFDTVVCSNVLEHIEADQAVLEGLRKLRVPGGRVVLVVPALHALYGSIDRALRVLRRRSVPGLHARLTLLAVARSD